MRTSKILAIGVALAAMAVFAWPDFFRAFVDSDFREKRSRAVMEALEAEQLKKDVQTTLDAAKAAGFPPDICPSLKRRLTEDEIIYKHFSYYNYPRKIHGNKEVLTQVPYDSFTEFVALFPKCCSVYSGEYGLKQRLARGAYFQSTVQGDKKVRGEDGSIKILENVNSVMFVTACGDLIDVQRGK